MYATEANMALSWDARVIGDLLDDTGTRVTNLTGNAVLIEMLSQASGMINTAALVSERYTVADLMALTGDDQAFLRRLTCDLAYGLLLMRRGHDLKDIPQWDQAMAYLEALRQGERLFAVPRDIQASTVVFDFPTFAAYEQLQLLRDRCRRYFPIRREQKTVNY